MREIGTVEMALWALAMAVFSVYMINVFLFLVADIVGNILDDARWVAKHKKSKRRTRESRRVDFSY